jgi:hypothetical protein
MKHFLHTPLFTAVFARYTKPSTSLNYRHKNVFMKNILHSLLLIASFLLVAEKFWRRRLAVIITMAILLLGNNSFAATFTENFDVAGNWAGGTMTSYNAKTYIRSGQPVTFAATSLRETAGTQDGFAATRGSSTHAWRIENALTPSWTATVATGGVGTFSVYVRRWDNTPDPSYVCEYSINNGSTWTSVQTINNTWLGSSDWKQITGTINTSNTTGASDDIIIRIRRVSGERIMIDDFEMTDYASATTTITQLTTGIASSPLTASTTNQAIFGFSASSTGTPNLTAFNVGTSSTSASKFGNIKLYRSTDNSYATAGDNTEITGITVSQTGSRIRLSGFTEALSGTAKNFFIAIDVDGSVNGSTTAVQPSLANDSVTVSAGTVTGGTLTGTSFAFAASGSPPSITSATSASANYFTPFSYFITASNSPTSYNATSLPTWLTVNTSTGEVSGTPTVATGTFPITVTASNANGPSTAQNVTITVGTKNLTIVNISIDNKVYNKNSTATITGTPALVGVHPSDNVNVSGGTATFNSVTVANGVATTVSGYTLSGLDAAKYSLTQPSGLTANITPKALTVSSPTATNRAYNGLNTVTVGGTLVGVESGDLVNLSTTGTMANATSGNGKAVTFSISGADVGNYTLTQPSTTVDIAKVDLTATADNKTKNQGAVNPALTISYSGFVNSETVAAITPPTASTTAVTASPVGTYPITLTGSSATNYNIILVDGTLTVAVGPCGTESFANSNATATYASSSFTGDNGVTWTYTASRDDATYQITGAGLLLRRLSDNSKVVSSSVSGGIANFSCKLLKGFTGPGNRQVALYVNNIFQANSTAWDNTSVQTFTVNDINISGNVVVEIRNTTGNQVVVDDISWTCYTACTPPSNSAATLTFSNPTSSSLDLNFTRGNGDSVLIVAKAGSAATDPTTNTPYNLGDAVGGGTVVYKGIASGINTATTQTIGSLSAETQYYFNIYEYTTSTKCYQATPLSGNRYTLSNEPSAQPASGLSSTSCTATSVDVTVPAASSGADGYLLIYRASGAPTGLPTDANSYSSGNTFGDATVAQYVNNASTVTVSGLTASTNYYFQIIPYNANSGAVAQTFNYLTTGSILQTNFSTPATSSSSSSRVGTSVSYAYTPNIAYTTYQTAPVPASAGSSVGVYQITIKDGDGATNDADTLPTILSQISFTNTGTANTIRAAALFTSSDSKITGGDGTVTANGISFSSLGSDNTAADGDSTKLILRVTFNNTVTDSQKLVFTVSSVTAAGVCTSSQFALSNGGGASSENNTANNNNRIKVVATKLVFGTGPSSTSNGSPMSTVTVIAQDANNNVDINFTSDVTLTCSNAGALSSGGGPVTPTTNTGTATFGSVIHGTDGTYTMTASASGVSASPNSGSYEISSIPANSYRTISDGTWPGGSASWERLISGTWTASTPSASTTSLLIISDSVTSRASFASSSPYTSMIVESGGVFIAKHNSTFSSILIKNGGKFIVEDPSVDLDAAGTLTVDSGGIFIINSGTLNHADNLFAGTENFKTGSTVEIKNYDNDSSPGEDDLIESNNPIALNSDGYYFGHLFINIARTLPANNKAFTLVGITGNSKLCKGNLTIANQDTFQVLLTNVRGNIEIGGNVLVTKNKFSFAGITAVIDTHTVRGNITVNGAGAIIDLNSTSSGSASVLVNLEGDLIGTLGTISSTDDGCGIAFTDTAIQNINVADAVPFNNINCFVRNAANVQLLDNNLKLNNNSTFRVDKGGTFNFNWVTDSITPLLITNGASGTNTFTSQDSSVLKITHLSGLVKNTAAAGNVQLSISNKTFSQVATFHYIGKANQVTGNAITSGSSGKIIICDLIDNNTQLTFTDSTGITNNTAASPTGGKLDIRKGQVIESTTAYITGSTGTLYMSEGTLYKIAKGNSNASSSYNDLIPRMTGGSYPYVLNGGTIEFAGEGPSNAFQTIRASTNPSYINLKFSGANTFGSDYKSLSNRTNIDSSLVLSGATVVDCITSSGNAASFTGTGALIMDGGRLRIKKLNDLNPELDGTARNYAVTGGTIEFYGSGATQNQRLRGTDGGGTITYHNIEINAAATNLDFVTSLGNVSSLTSFAITGTMNINKPASFRIGVASNVSGSGNFIVNDSSTLFYASANGIKTSGTGTSDGNIRVSGTRTFSQDASYGFIGTQAMISGDALPSEVVNLYVAKSANIDVELTNSVEVKETLQFLGGVLQTTGSNEVFVSNTDNIAISGGQTSSTDKYIQGRLKWKTDGASSYTFPIGHSTQDAQGFTIDVTGADGSEILGFLETNNTSPLQSFAYCDLEKHPGGGVAVDVGSGTVGYDGVLDQVALNLESPLQWNVTNPGGGINSYDITVQANGGQDINPVVSANGLPIRYLMKNGEPGNPGINTGTGAQFTQTGFLACPNGYSLSGMTSFSDFTLNGGNAGGSQLPVKLLFFNASRIENKAKLSWATSLEINNEKFEIERSADAVSFEKIATVKGGGNTTNLQDYATFDEQPLSGWNYYRLKQIDFDQAFEYSNIASVYFEEGEFAIAVYPNPAKNSIMIQTFGDTKIYDAAIYNSLGQEIRKAEFNINMSIEDLASGTYTIKVIAGEKIIVKQIVKQ